MCGETLNIRVFCSGTTLRMKVFLSKIIHWILVLGIVINIDGTFAQAESTIQDIINLCNEQSRLHCEWLENYRQQNMVNDVLRQISEDSTTNFGQYRPTHNHISPRFASYESTKDVPQYPFSAGWKGQLNKIMNNNWSNGKPGKTKSRKQSNYDNKRTPPNMFSSWGGKRVPLTPDDSATKREPAFSSWGGKRTQKFFNWGGKRSIPDSEYNDRIDDNYEHNIMKRDVTTSNENDTASRKKRATDKKLCITDELNLQELFKEFIEWSRRQPEQKKGSFYKKMLVSTLHSPDNMSRRAGSFFQWGGKRSLKQN